MKYLTEVKTDGDSFQATFWNGKTTDTYEVAAFYMIMQDKDYDIEETRSMISAGKAMDPFKPWPEIEAIIE